MSVTKYDRLTRMKRILLMLILIPLVGFADSRILFHSHIRFRYDLQQFPDAREDVKRFHLQWRPRLEFRIHPTLDDSVEAFADETH